MESLKLKIEEYKKLIESISSKMEVENENTTNEKKEPERHFLNFNGSKLLLDRASSILSIYYDSKYKDSKIPKEMMVLGGERGTAIHNAIEFYINNEMELIGEQFKPYFTEWKEWYLKQKTTTIFMEKRLWNPKTKTSLKPDWYRYDENKNKFILSDFKTNSKADLFIWSAQLWNYKQALLEHGFPVDEIEIIHISKEGKGAKLEVYNIDETMEEQGKKLFNACLIVLRLTRSNVL